MRVAYVSDQRFYRCGDAWYTTASFPLAFYAERLGATAWTFWGRLHEVARADRLFRLDLPPALAGRVSFAGPRGARSGPAGYARALLTAGGALLRTVRSAEVVWLKQPTAFGALALPLCRAGQVVVSQQVGDAAQGLALTYPRWRALAGPSAWACRRSSARADVAAFVSRQLAEAYGGGRPDLVVANESRITEELLAPAPAPQGPGPLEVVFVGRLAPEKRVEDLLHAVARVPQARLRLLGDGPQREALARRAGELGLAGRVELAGYLPWGPALFQALRAASVLALPSATEGLPLVLVEAMSQGVPVVATRVGGVPELVEDGVSGLLVEPGRPDQLATALARLAGDPALRTRLAAGGLSTARGHTLARQTGVLLDRVRAAHEARTPSSAQGSAGGPSPSASGARSPAPAGRPTSWEASPPSSSTPPR